MAGKIIELSDEQWRQVADLFPPVIVKRSRSNRECLDAILTAAASSLSNKWSALNDTGLCPASTASNRLKKWWEDGFLDLLAATTLRRDTSLRNVDWAWLCNGGTSHP